MIYQRSATNPIHQRGPCKGAHLSSLTALPHDGLHQAHRVGDGGADERHSRRGGPVHVAADALRGAAHQRLLLRVVQAQESATKDPEGGCGETEGIHPAERTKQQQ